MEEVAQSPWTDRPRLKITFIDKPNQRLSIPYILYTDFMYHVTITELNESHEMQQLKALYNPNSEMKLLCHIHMLFMHLNNMTLHK